MVILKRPIGQNFFGHKVSGVGDGISLQMTVQSVTTKYRMQTG